MKTREEGAPLLSDPDVKKKSQNWQKTSMLFGFNFVVAIPAPARCGFLASLMLVPQMPGSSMLHTLS